VGAKNERKKTSEVVRKSRFFIHTNIVLKKGGKKRAKQFFQKQSISANIKCREKIVGKIAKKRFLYSHKYRDKKRGEKNARNNSTRNRRVVRAKNVGEKIGK